MQACDYKILIEGNAILSFLIYLKLLVWHAKLNNLFTTRAKLSILLAF